MVRSSASCGSIKYSLAACGFASNNAREAASGLRLPSKRNSVLDLRDPVSSASHLFTAIWAVFATLVMLRLTANRPGRLLPIVIFGASMVLLYTASGTFHGLHYDTPEQKRLFQKIDQTAVYLLIAGSYTPVLSILLAGAWRRWFLRMTWL